MLVAVRGAGRRVVCLGRAAWCARGRRPAREIATRELRSARRLEARPGPATAHGRRSLALRTLRLSPRRRRLVRINFARNSPGAVLGFES